MRMFLTLVLIMMSSAFAMAQETYGIKIAGEDITGYNRYDLTEISGVSGKVYFDPNTRTLTLDNATIEANDYNAILNETCDYLSIELIGTNNIYVTGAAGINLKEETTIWSHSGGKLSVKSDGCALLFGGCPLEIDNCWLEAEGAWGISARNNVAEEVLKIRNSHVEAKGTSGSICDISSLKLEGSYIYSPSNAAYDADTKSVAVNGVTVTKKVVIEPGYGIKIAGVKVTKDNCKDLTEINGVSGKVYFDPSTRTLTLDNATIEADGCNAIWNETCDNLLIKLLGTNTINVTNSAGIYMCESTTIVGGSGSKLTIKNDRCAVLFEGCPLEISNCWLEVEGDWGISANDNVAEEVLKIRNSHVEATGPTGSICDIAGLELDGCHIDIPSKAVYNADTKSVAVNGVTVTDKVVIEPDSYGIKIDDKYVTSLNCKDLSVIDGVDGKMSYNPETKTLTMEDVTINMTGENIGIWNREVKGLKINLVGNNTITSRGSCITIHETSTISGSGTLSLKSSENCGLYLPSSLTVEDVKLYAEGKYGVAGDDGKSGEILTLRNSYVEATGSSGSICDLQNLVLDGCSITQPTGAAFDANVHAVALNGEAVTDKVVIESDNNSIGTITVDVPARKQGIYNLNGVKLTQQWDDLPAGIYIVDGVKRVKN